MRIRKHIKTKHSQNPNNVAQNVGKVWISRKKTFPVPFHAISGDFFMDQKITKHAPNLIIFLGGPMGPIHTVWGHVLVSFNPIPGVAKSFKLLSPLPADALSNPDPGPSHMYPEMKYFAKGIRAVDIK